MRHWRPCQFSPTEILCSTATRSRTSSPPPPGRSVPPSGVIRATPALRSTTATYTAPFQHECVMRTAQWSRRSGKPHMPCPRLRWSINPIRACPFLYDAAMARGRIARFSNIPAPTTSRSFPVFGLACADKFPANLTVNRDAAQNEASRIRPHFSPPK